MFVCLLIPPGISVPNVTALFFLTLILRVGTVVPDRYSLHSCHWQLMESHAGKLGHLRGGLKHNKFHFLGREITISLFLICFKRASTQCHGSTRVRTTVFNVCAFSQTVTKASETVWQRTERHCQNEQGHLLEHWETDKKSFQHGVNYAILHERVQVIAIIGTPALLQERTEGSAVAVITITQTLECNIAIIQQLLLKKKHVNYILL